MSKGYIYLERKLMDNWVWQSPEYGYAWIDLLLLANHKDDKILIDNELIDVKRGEHITSISKLAKRWNCTREKTRTILDNFEKDGMITRKTTTKFTQLNIVNYGVYQDSSHKGPSKVVPKVTPKAMSKAVSKVVPQTINDKEMIINEKEMKKEKAALQPNPFGFEWE